VQSIQDDAKWNDRFTIMILTVFEEKWPDSPSDFYSSASPTTMARDQDFLFTRYMTGMVIFRSYNHISVLWISQCYNLTLMIDAFNQPNHQNEGTISKNGFSTGNAKPGPL